MTAKEVERLARVEEKQENLTNTVQELKDDSANNFTEINKKLDALTTTLDNLQGGKAALIWVFGIALTLGGLLIAGYNVFKKD